MNDDFIRKYVYEEQQDHILDAIRAVNERVDDLHSEFLRDLAIIGIFIAVLAAAIPIGLYYLQILMNIPH